MRTTSLPGARRLAALVPVLLPLVAACGNDSSHAFDAGNADGGDGAAVAPDARADQTSPATPDAAADDTAPDAEDAGNDATVDATETADAADANDADANDAGAADAATDASGADAAPAGPHVFVPLQGTGAVALFSADGAGNLTPSAGSPFDTGRVAAFSVTGNAAGTRVYVGVVGGAGAASVAAFTLDANGAIAGTQTGSPFATGVSAAPTRIVTNPAATRLYVVHQGASAGSIAVFALDATGNVGALRSNSPVSTNTGTYAASVNPAGTRLYVTSQEKHEVFVFALDANGDITGQRPESPVVVTGSPALLLSAVHPSGGRLYVTDQDSEVYVFALDANGDVTGQVTGSPFATAGSSAGVAVNAGGTRLYVGTNSTTLDVFTLDAATGDLQGAAAPFSAGLATYDLALSPERTRLFVLDSNGGKLASVALDASGDPQSVGKVPVLDGGVFPTAVYAR